MEVIEPVYMDGSQKMPDLHDIPINVVNACLFHQGTVSDHCHVGKMYE